MYVFRPFIQSQTQSTTQPTKQRMKCRATTVLLDRLALDQTGREWDACYIQGTNLDSVSLFAVL
jgi:hypothetical protein